MIKLKEIRKKSGYTQIEVAHKIGFGQHAVSTWENQTREPDIKTLIKLANLFGCTVDELVGREEVEQEKKQPELVELEPADVLTDKQKELLNIIKNMDNDNINKIIGYAYSLNEKELTAEEQIKKLLEKYKNKK